MSKIRFVTRREMYEKRWVELAELLPLLRQAMQDFADGKITQYSLGHHGIQRQVSSLKDLMDLYKDLLLEYEELDNVLHGRSRRYVEVNYYQNPTNIRYW